MILKFDDFFFSCSKRRRQNESDEASSETSEHSIELVDTQQIETYSVNSSECVHPLNADGNPRTPSFSNTSDVKFPINPESSNSSSPEQPSPKDKPPTPETPTVFNVVLGLIVEEKSSWFVQCVKCNDIIHIERNQHENDFITFMENHYPCKEIGETFSPSKNELKANDFSAVVKVFKENDHFRNYAKCAACPLLIKMDDIMEGCRAIESHKNIYHSNVNAMAQN